MSDAILCPQCQQPIPPDAPGGLCPVCLLVNGQTATIRQGHGAGRFMPPPPAELAPDFPQLEVLEVIGQGGMGAVYKARQRHLDRIVALKILRPDLSTEAAFSERFAREARALARLSHPHLVTVHDFGQSGRWFWIIMEHVEGANLRQILATGHLSQRQALEIVPQLCEALQYAHDRGVVHRDIKPENILLDVDGQVKVADFGLAKLVQGESAEHPLTNSQDVVGTAHYMAPEQIECSRDVDHRADIYSLGVVFYEMLTGGLPLGRFSPPSQATASDPQLDQVVMRTLEKDPGQRYQQVSEVKTAVQQVGHGAAVPPAAALVPGAIAVPPAAAGAALRELDGALLLAGGMLLLLMSIAGPEQPGRLDHELLVIPTVAGLMAVWSGIQAWRARGDERWVGRGKLLLALATPFTFATWPWLGVALCVLALRWFWQYRRQQRHTAPAAPPFTASAPTPATAATAITATATAMPPGAPSGRWSKLRWLALLVLALVVLYPLLDSQHHVHAWLLVPFFLFVTLLTRPWRSQPAVVNPGVGYALVAGGLRLLGVLVFSLTACLCTVGLVLALVAPEKLRELGRNGQIEINSDTSVHAPRLVAPGTASGDGDHPKPPQEQGF
jgi:tRNA A-37 threonylcarbamoyl transferase component Bud32